MRALAMALATVGGVGYAPVASGTFGSMVAVPLLPALAALRAHSWPAYLATVAALVGIAVWASGRAEDILGGHDHSRIVIDEVAGLVVAGVFLPGTWGVAIAAFLVFRVFDVLKPFPAGRIDDSVEGGLGVVGDDIVAGLYTGILLRLALSVV